jgi:hypothetical protein
MLLGVGKMNDFLCYSMIAFVTGIGACTSHAQVMVRSSFVSNNVLMLIETANDPDPGLEMPLDTRAILWFLDKVPSSQDITLPRCAGLVGIGATSDGILLQGFTPESYPRASLFLVTFEPFAQVKLLDESFLDATAIPLGAVSIKGLSFIVVRTFTQTDYGELSLLTCPDLKLVSKCEIPHGITPKGVPIATDARIVVLCSKGTYDTVLLLSAEDFRVESVIELREKIDDMAISENKLVMTSRHLQTQQPNLISIPLSSEAAASARQIPLIECALALPSAQGVFCSSDATISVRHGESGELLFKQHLDTKPGALEVSPDGYHVLATKTDGDYHLYRRAGNVLVDMLTISKVSLSVRQ